MKKLLKLVFVACIAVVAAEAALTLKQARAQGKICECPNGLVAAVEEKCANAAELQLVRGIAASTNSIRRGDIQKIAVKDGVSPQAAGIIIAEKIRKKYPSSACKGTRCPKI